MRKLKNYGRIMKEDIYSEGWYLALCMTLSVSPSIHLSVSAFLFFKTHIRQGRGNFPWKLYVTQVNEGDLKIKDDLKNGHDLKFKDHIKNYETYNNERKKQVFASSSKFQIKRVR